MESKWRKAYRLHRLVAILTAFISLSVVLFAVLQLQGIWNGAMKFCIPSMGIVMFCQAYLLWETNRTVAYFSIAAATFSFACTRAFVFC